MRNTNIHGTREWAVANVNCVSGCSHNCRYCYAKSMAWRFGRITSSSEWQNASVRWHDVKKKRRKYNGTVMFPTSHDVTPDVLEPCMTVLEKLFDTGNDVLFVSKPHLPCITSICKEFAKFKDQLLFRFSIGATDNSLLSYWEPGAPPFDERLECLKFSHELGFRTSVSAEPLLDTPNAGELYEILVPYVNDSIWFGKINRIRNCVRIETAEDEKAVRRIEHNQTDERILDLYSKLKDKPLARWKESVKKIVGIELPTEAGLDI